jgi:AcrR family transcriptional regulator
VTKAEPAPVQPGTGQPGAGALPPGLDLLWGRRERGKRGPRPGLSAEAIVGAAIRVADAEGLEAVSMARVAHELGFTTMSLYRHVASKEELLQLMWNASAIGAESLVLEGDGWRARLRMWATIQREMLDQHPWITQMPMAAPPLAPNSLHFVEHGMAAFDGTGLPDAYRIRVIGLISSYTLNEARMAHDAARAVKQALEARQAGEPGRDPQAGQAGQATGTGADAAPLPTYESLLRVLIDQESYPRLHRLAWTGEVHPVDERAEFLWGLDRILDGVQVLIGQAGDASRELTGCMARCPEARLPGWAPPFRTRLRPAISMACAPALRLTCTCMREPPAGTRPSSRRRRALTSGRLTGCCPRWMTCIPGCATRSGTASTGCQAACSVLRRRSSRPGGTG